VESMTLFSQLRKLDAYPKFHDEVKVKTFSGAAVSIVAGIIMLSLFFSQLSIYLKVQTVDHLVVDTARGEKLRINFDVTFPRIPCHMLSVDAMDVSGAHQLDLDSHIKKKALDSYGRVMGEEMLHELGHTAGEDESRTNKIHEAQERMKQPGYCGDCYGAQDDETPCCNTCDEVRKAYSKRGWALKDVEDIEQCLVSGQTPEGLRQQLERGDGCRMYGFLEVNKVAGNFHFAPGKSYQHSNVHVHDLDSFDATTFNVSHAIHHLSFGEKFPGIVNPLDNVQKSFVSSKDAPQSGGMYMYYVKVVPTSYSYLTGEKLQTNQYSVTEHFRHISPQETTGLPGLFVFYELSPIMVQFTEHRQPLTTFLTQLCAIIGGVFTVAGIIDRLVYSSIRQIEKKMEIGKLS